MHDVEQVLSEFLSKNSTKNLVVGFSGGLDSSVLLHAITKLSHSTSQKVTAVHVNHQLQAEANQWESHCANVAKALGVVFVSERVTISKDSNIEAAARDVRYQVFEKILSEDAILLLAHHQQDLVESVFINLLRGSGPAGLAGMPYERKLGSSMLYRPLLKLAREQLEAYAETSNLSWIEDPSNDDTRFRRNFLRQEIIPKLKLQWPGLQTAISRSAELCGEAMKFQNNWVASALTAMENNGALQLSKLDALPKSQQLSVLRYWTQQHSGHSLTQAQADSLHAQMLTLRDDAQPAFEIGDYTVRRYKTQLYLVPSLDYNYAEFSVDMRPGCEVTLPDGRQLQVFPATEAQQSLGLEESDTLRVCFRRGGEKVRYAEGSKSLKQFFQDKNIPVWQRDSLPLVFLGKELVAVANLWVNPNYHYENQPDRSAYSVFFRTP